MGTKEMDLHYEKMMNSIAATWAEVMSDPIKTSIVFNLCIEVILLTLSLIFLMP